MLKKCFPAAAGLCLILFASVLSAAELRVGAAKADVTPKGCAPLWGQFHLRLAQGTKSPLTANVCAIEAVEGDKALDAAILVSLDLVHMPQSCADLVREKTAALDASIPTDKIVMFAVHSHDGPTLTPGAELPKREGVEDYPETIDNFAAAVAETIVQAWQSRVPANFSWGLEQLVLGESRRVCYFDGSAKMYGNTNDPNFSHFENRSDPDMGVLFFWDKAGKLLSVVVNYACPSQIVEHLSVYCADFADEIRGQVCEHFGDDSLVVLPCVAPAGDDSPHPQYRKEAYNREIRLRYGEGDILDLQMKEFGRRVTRAVDDAYQCAEKDIQSDVPFAHLFEVVPLQMRAVTEEEYNESKAEMDRVQKQLDENTTLSPAEVAFMGIGWYGSVVQRYQRQQTNGIEDYPANVHVIRIGDVVMATNQFELFNDYAMRIKARSPAMATFLYELADGDGSYLPTARAIAGGGYSAVIQSDQVSPEGGQQLVNETLRMIGQVWNEKQ